MYNINVAGIFHNLLENWFYNTGIIPDHLPVINGLNKYY